MLFLCLLFFPSIIGFSEYEVTLLDDLAINVAFQFWSLYCEVRSKILLKFKKG